MTGMMAGFTLFALLSAQAAETTDSIKATKAQLLDKGAVKMQKARTGGKTALRKAAVKSWKNYGPGRRTTSTKRYLGSDRAWYGDSRYFGSKPFRSSSICSPRSKRATYTSRYYRPSQARAYIYYGSSKPAYGWSAKRTPTCKMRHSHYGVHRCCCCGR